MTLRYRLTHLHRSTHTHTRTHTYTRARAHNTHTPDQNRYANLRNNAKPATCQRPHRTTTNNSKQQQTTTL